MSVKAVLFDLDGTLLNTIDDLANAVNYALNKEGYPTHDVEKFKYFVGNGTDLMIKRALPEDKKDMAYVEKLKPIYVQYYDAHSDIFTRPYDGILELLKELKEKGIKLAVVSNKIDCMTQLVIEQYFPDTFDFVSGQKDGYAVKPDPDLALLATEKLGVKPSDCLFVGDTGVDAATGKNAGIFTVGVLWGFRDEAELLENGANAIISKPSELHKYL